MNISYNCDTGTWDYGGCDGSLIAMMVEWLQACGVPVAHGGIFFSDLGPGTISLNEAGTHIDVTGGLLAWSVELANPECLEEVLGAVLAAMHSKSVLMGGLDALLKAGCAKMLNG